MALGHDLGGRGQADVLSELVARFEIASLIHRYALAMDERDAGGVVKLYSSDGAFDRVQGAVTGPEELTQAYEDMTRRFQSMRHMPAVHVIHEIAGDEATGTQMGTAELVENGALLRAAYRFNDHYVLLPDGWRFRRRSLRYMYVVPYDELPTVFAGADRIRWPGREPKAAHFE